MDSKGSSDGRYEIKSDILARIRDRNPAVHCIINEAALNITANVILAIGATPSFSFDSHDLYSFIKSSDAVSINLGMLMGTKRRAIRNACVYTTHFKRPWVLDPTMVNRSASRTRFCREILEFKPNAIRGNSDEIETISRLTRRSTQQLCLDYETVFVETGLTDNVTSASRQARIKTGHERMTSVTGIGCALSALTAAALTVSDDVFDAAKDILQIYGDIGIEAAGKSRGPGTFVGYFIDGLHNASRI